MQVVRIIRMLISMLMLWAMIDCFNPLCDKFATVASDDFIVWIVPAVLGSIWMVLAVAVVWPPTQRS